MSYYEELWIIKGPGRANYFVKDDPWPRGRTLGQAFTLGGARRKARRLMKKPKRDHSYRTVEQVGP